MTVKKGLAIVGGLAVLGFVAKQWADDVASKIEMAVQNVRVENFWNNLLKFRIVCVASLYLKNRNDFPIDLKSFEGALTYKEEKVTNIRLDNATTLAPSVPQTINFRFETKLGEAVARIFLAFRDQKSIDGARMKGTLTVKLKGLTLPVPYNELITIGL